MRNPGNRSDSARRRAAVYSDTGFAATSANSLSAQPVFMKATRASDTGKSWDPVFSRCSAMSLLGSCRHQKVGDPLYDGIGK